MMKNIVIVCGLFFFIFIFMGRFMASAQPFSQGEDETFFLSKIQQSPNDSLQRDYLGEFYLTQSAYDKAILSFQTAVSLNPSDMRARYDLGVTYEDLGNDQAALQAYQDAADWALYGLNFREGLCYNKLGEYEKALSYFQKVKSVMDTPGVHYASAMAEAGLKNYDAAVKELSAAQEMDPHFVKGKEYFSEFSDLEQERAAWIDAARHKVILKIEIAIGGVIVFPALFFLLRFFSKRSNRIAEDEF